MLLKLIKWVIVGEYFQWKMQGVTMVFMVELFLLPLGGRDVVSGIHLFASLGKLHFDFSNHYIEFTMKGEMVMLRWVKTMGSHRARKCCNKEEKYM